jgi:hypothetical protein
MNGFSEKVGFRLEVIDLRDVKTPEEFQARARSLGWGVVDIPK